MTKEDFWNWFDNHRSALEDLISEKTKDYEVYENLSEQLLKYNEFLIPEITRNELNEFVLVISCDGMKQGIPFVEKLTEDLKTFDNWVILKFRQQGPMEVIPVNGLILKRRNIFLQWQKMPSQKYYLTFYVKGFSFSNPAYEIGTLLHLDHTIGEYNAMTRIEGAEMKKLGWFQSKKELRTLDELLVELENEFA